MDNHPPLSIEIGAAADIDTGIASAEAQVDASLDLSDADGCTCEETVSVDLETSAEQLGAGSSPPPRSLPLRGVSGADGSSVRTRGPWQHPVPGALALLIAGPYTGSGIRPSARLHHDTPVLHLSKQLGVFRK